MNKHKAFTIIELLIVMAVIGTLSAMMMMSSTETVSSSNAMNILTNLRSLSTAAMSLYTDNLDFCRRNPNASTDLMPYVRPYLYKGTVYNTKPNDADDVYKNYYVRNFNGTWCAGYGFTNINDNNFNNDDSSLKGKLRKHTSTDNLLGSTSNSTEPTAGYDHQGVVWMKIRSR